MKKILLAMLACTLFVNMRCGSDSFSAEIDPEVTKHADMTVQKANDEIIYLIRLHEDMPRSKYLIFKAYDGNDKLLGEIDINVGELPNFSQRTQNENEFTFRTSSTSNVRKVKVTLDNSTHGPSLPIGSGPAMPQIPQH